MRNKAISSNRFPHLVVNTLRSGTKLFLSWWGPFIASDFFSATDFIISTPIRRNHFSLCKTSNQTGTAVSKCGMFLLQSYWFVDLNMASIHNTSTIRNISDEYLTSIKIILNDEQLKAGHQCSQHSWFECNLKGPLQVCMSSDILQYSTGNISTRNGDFCSLKHPN